MMPKHKYPTLLIYEQIVGEMLFDPLDKERNMGRHYDEDGDGIADRPSLTAGEEDHSDPWVYAGEDADPPTDPGGEA